MISPAAILRKLPPVPSATPVYKTTLTTTTNEDTTTWTSVDIGVPHRKRIIVLAAYHGVANILTSATVNGIPHFWQRQNQSHEVSLLAVQVPDGETAEITLTGVGSIRKAVAVYVFYPQDHTIIETLQATANTTTNATCSDLKVANRGCAIYVGAQHATLGTFTTTWTAGDAVNEDVDAQLESAASYTMGHIDVTVSSDTNDLTLAESTSGTKRLAVASWGPCAPYAGLTY